MERTLGKGIKGNMQRKCLLCGKAAATAFKTRDWNRKVSPEEFEYCLCSECGLLFLANAPAQIERYYGIDYYQPLQLEKLKKVAAAEAYQLAMVTRFKSGGRLLEIGPGFGVFAYQAQQAGFQVEVIEKEAKCCSFISEKLGIKAICSNAPEQVIAQEPGYDVICLWHVIEHLPAAFEFLNQAAEKLNHGGILLVAAPNPAAFQFRIQGSAWPHIDAPRHLWLIPAALLEKYMLVRKMRVVFASYDDKGARSWNCFGWQRYLMNAFSSAVFQAAAYCAGRGVSLVMSPFDRAKGRGSAYTLVFQKIKNN